MLELDRVDIEVDFGDRIDGRESHGLVRRVGLDKELC